MSVVFWEALQERWVPAEVLEHAAGDLDEVAGDAGPVCGGKARAADKGVDAMAELVEDGYEVAVADEGWAGRCVSLDGG